MNKLSVQPIPLSRRREISLVAAPGVPVQPTYQPGPQWIAMDIFEQRQQICVSLNQNGLVTSPEERSVAVMSPVETLVLTSIHMSHESRKIGARSLDRRW